MTLLPNVEVDGDGRCRPTLDLDVDLRSPFAGIATMRVIEPKQGPAVEMTRQALAEAAGDPQPIRAGSP